jgi:hypothetical protein
VTDKRLVSSANPYKLTLAHETSTGTGESTVANRKSLHFDADQEAKMEEERSRKMMERLNNTATARNLKSHNKKNFNTMNNALRQ